MDAATEMEVDIDEESDNDEDLDRLDGEGNAIPTTFQSALPQCSKCLKVYQKESNKKLNEEKCQGNIGKVSLSHLASIIAFDSERKVYYDPTCY